MTTPLKLKSAHTQIHNSKVYTDRRTTGRAVVLSRAEPRVDTILVESMLAIEQADVGFWFIVIETNETLKRRSFGERLSIKGWLTRSTQLFETCPSSSSFTNSDGLMTRNPDCSISVLVTVSDLMLLSNSAISLN